MVLMKTIVFVHLLRESKFYVLNERIIKENYFSSEQSLILKAICRGIHNIGKTNSFLGK